MKNNIKLIPIIIGAISIASILYYYIGCPIRFLTGMPCISCGMTHALYYLMTGNIDMSISYHPLAVIMPVIVLIIILHKYLSKPSLIVLDTIVILLFIIVYICRFTNPSDMVITFDINKSIWSRYL